MAHYKRNHSRKIRREEEKREFYKIVDSTSSFYGKRGNVNSMNPYNNITVARHGDDTALEHWRVDMGCYHYNRNLKKEYAKKIWKK